MRYWEKTKGTVEESVAGVPYPASAQSVFDTKG